MLLNKNVEDERMMVSNNSKMNRRRRGSSILTKSICGNSTTEQQRIESPLISKQRLEFESCWEIQEEYFAKFESVELLSRKGNSCLYLVKQHQHCSELKVLRLIQCSTPNEAQLLNYHFERIIHQLSNLPNRNFFVHIYNSSIIGENTVAVEMEHVEMGNLQSLIEDEGVLLSDEMVAQIISQISQAIQWLNDKNLYHGNIRPHNILVKSFNDDLDVNEIKIVLSDFGWKEEDSFSNSEKRFTLPKTYSTGHSSSHASGVGSGGDKKLMDIYHLGVTLYQICSRDKELILSQLYEQNQEEEMLINEALYSRLSKCFSHNRRELVDLILRMVSKSYNVMPPSTRDIDVITSQNNHHHHSSIVSLS